jgi:spermidine/putrescine transport system substrate-binding protein
MTHGGSRSSAAESRPDRVRCAHRYAEHRETLGLLAGFLYHIKRRLHMRKLLTAAFAASIVLAVTGCAGGNENKLFIYNWTYYIPDDVLRNFEKEFETTVVYDVFASNEEMFAKLKAGGTGYDIVFPSGDYVSIMISEKMVEPIDKTRLPNLKNLDPAMIDRIEFDPGTVYSVPYFMGAAGISVNTTKVNGYERSWNIFNRADLQGRMTMLDDMREVLGGALKSLGYSVNSKDPAELEQAKRLVIGWRENIMKFDAEAFAKGFAAEEFFVVHGYAENVFLEYDPDRHDEVDFFIPKEGGPMYMDSMVILKGAKHTDLAYKFMDYIHRPEVYARIADSLMLPSLLNVPARGHMTVTPSYGVEDLENCEFKEDVGEAIELYNRIWQEIRIGS